MQTVPGGMSAKTFLAKYWQKKPLLIRNAMTNLEEFVSREQLINISTQSHVTSRLVQYYQKNDRWTLDFGPFHKDDFKKLKGKVWTLLVQDMDVHSARTAEVLEFFSFIPKWRTDDVMISYASKGGSVGPHVDNYDVFLIQGAGRRRWQIGNQKVQQDDFREDSDLRILKSFKADEAWDLNPGDMLYLPPRIPHYGVSLDDECMTYSVGYRAPRYIDLLQEFISTEANAPTLFNFYEDPGRKVAKHSGEIAAKELKEIFRKISSFKLNELNFKRWMVRQLSEPKSDFEAVPKPRGEGALCRAPGTKAFYAVIGGNPYLSINGEAYDLKPSDLEFCKLITSEKKPPMDLIKNLTKKQRRLLEIWIARGWFTAT